MTEEHMLHLFIDTNILLRYFAATDDKIDHLATLVDMIEKERIKLYVPQQLRDEFNRNREKQLNESISALADTPQNKPYIPRFLDGYDEAAALTDAHKTYKKALSELVQKARAEAKSGNLHADKLVGEVFAAANVMKHDATVFAKATLRMQLNNPPGKDHSLGDRLNWEYLLTKAQPTMTLHVVSVDSDFVSKLDNQEAHKFLVREWAALTGGGKLLLYKTIGQFLSNTAASGEVGRDEKQNGNEVVPDITAPVDPERESDRAAAVTAESLTDEFLLSGSFADTHRAIAKIGKNLSILSPDDRSEILDAATNNNQIYYIRRDDDVNEFLNQVLQAQKHAMPTNEYENYLQWLNG